MKKTLSIPIAFILISFLYSLTHLSEINQMTALTFIDVTQLFYAIFFWILLFGIARNYGFFDFIGYIFHPIFHLILKLNIQETAIFIASIFSGYPTNAKIIKDNHISKESTLHLLKFCSHPSIGFVVVTLGLGIFNDISIGYYLFLIQILSSFTIALFNRKSHIDFSTNIVTPLSLIPLIKQQLKSAFEVFIYIFGFMLVFRIIYIMIPINNIFLSGLLEFSQGCLSLHGYDSRFAFIICSFFLSFSSLSVISQTLSILDDFIDFKTLFIYRLIQALISLSLATLFSFFIF